MDRYVQARFLLFEKTTAGLRRMMLLLAFCHAEGITQSKVFSREAGEIVVSHKSKVSRNLIDDS
jgi:hypothetical protein